MCLSASWVHLNDAQVRGRKAVEDLPFTSHMNHIIPHSTHCITFTGHAPAIVAWTHSLSAHRQASECPTRALCFQRAWTCLTFGTNSELSFPQNNDNRHKPLEQHEGKPNLEFLWSLSAGLKASGNPIHARNKESSCEKVTVTDNRLFLRGQGLTGVLFLSFLFTDVLMQKPSDAWW